MQFVCFVQRVMSQLSAANVGRIDQQNTSAFRSKCEPLKWQVCVRVLTGKFFRLQHSIDSMFTFQHELSVHETALQVEEISSCENLTTGFKKGQPSTEKVSTNSNPSRFDAPRELTLSTALSTSRYGR